MKKGGGEVEKGSDWGRSGGGKIKKKKKGFFWGRGLKMEMDIEVGEGDDGEEREQKEGGEIKKKIRG